MEGYIGSHKVYVTFLSTAYYIVTPNSIQVGSKILATKSINFGEEISLDQLIYTIAPSSSTKLQPVPPPPFVFQEDTAG
jgi:hypothetical protein